MVAQLNVHTSSRVSSAPAVEILSTVDAMRHVRWDPSVDKDTGADAANGDFANTTSPLTVTDAVTNYPTAEFVAGKLFKLESEVLEVYKVAGNDVTFTRGVADTTIASHADAVSIYTANDADDEFRVLAKAAREQIEADAEVALVTQSITLTLDRWPRTIELRHPPVQSVTSIQYVDQAGTTQTYATANYRVDTASRPGRVTLAYQVTRPVVRTVTNAVTVVYVAGYGDDRSDVPEVAIHAARLLVGHWYCNREAVGGRMAEVPVAYRALVDSLREGSPV